MPRRSSIIVLLAAIMLSWLTARGRADQEAELLRKFHKQNQGSASKLKQEAARLLSQHTSGHPETDVMQLRKLLVQLQEDRLLPHGERTLLLRQLQERLRLCKSLAEKAPPPVAKTAPPRRAPVGDGKLRVLPTAVMLGGTTVNVPDGGTRVLGGAGFMSSGRNEGGVPVLGKLPYLGRGFRNVGYGSSISSVQSSVSVRIIILEEEAAKLMQGQR